jgi:hypothetical protein
MYAKKETSMKQPAIALIIILHFYNRSLFRTLFAKNFRHCLAII